MAVAVHERDIFIWTVNDHLICSDIEPWVGWPELFWCDSGKDKCGEGIGISNREPYLPSSSSIQHNCLLFREKVKKIWYSLGLCPSLNHLFKWFSAACKIFHVWIFSLSTGLSVCWLKDIQFSLFNTISGVKINSWKSQQPKSATAK